MIWNPYDMILMSSGIQKKRYPGRGARAQERAWPSMKLTIFAATGGIGRQLLEQAVDAGHDVTAVVRHPQNLPGELAGQVCVVAADLAAPGPAALTSAVQGADGVLSGLGPRSSTDAG